MNTKWCCFWIYTNGVLDGWYYISQRVLKVSLKESPFLMVVAKLHFWVYFITILLAVVTLYLWVIQLQKSMQNLEWPLDILVVVSGFYGVFQYLVLLELEERERYIFQFGILLLHLLQLQCFIYLIIWKFQLLLVVSGYGSWIHSVSMYAGTNDALVQWWYGHNAVASVFTTPIIALIYYFYQKNQVKIFIHINYQS